MNPDLPDAAVQFGAAAERAFASLGGVDVARAAEAAPDAGSPEALAALARLGIDDLDPRVDADALAAAAALCLAAGRVVLPCPVPSMLLRDEPGRPFAVVPADRCRVDHGHLFPAWRLSTVDGRPATAAGPAAPMRSRLGPFVADLPEPRPLPGDAGADVAVHLTLTAWQVLGTCARAVELTAEHVSGRIQFGKPLSAFQAVQFQLADADVAVAGLRELASFTLWRLMVAPDAALADALALRVHALDVARSVLRTCQQLHGAAGVCDEYDISVLVRHVQPALRLPFGAERTAAALAGAIGQAGFAGLFAHGADLHASHGASP